MSSIVLISLTHCLFAPLLLGFLYHGSLTYWLLALSVYLARIQNRVLLTPDSVDVSLIPKSPSRSNYLAFSKQITHHASQYHVLRYYIPADPECFIPSRDLRNESASRSLTSCSLELSCSFPICNIQSLLGYSDPEAVLLVMKSAVRKWLGLFFLETSWKNAIDTNVSRSIFCSNGIKRSAKVTLWAWWPKASVRGLFLGEHLSSLCCTGCHTLQRSRPSALILISPCCQFRLSEISFIPFLF